MKELISDATRRNWEKLNIGSSSGKLTARANKRLSDKKIIPLEYLSNRENLPFIKGLLAASSDNSWDMRAVLYTSAVRMLEMKGLLHQSHVQQVLQEYDIAENTEIRTLNFPEAETDILGLIYQAFRKEGEKNCTGAYYTKSKITHQMVDDLDFSKGQKLLDPCCGSGAFLLAAENAQPEQLVGMDVDPIAVMIAKCNLLLKYSKQEFKPQVFCGDYINQLQQEFVDYIITNPPWGAVIHSEIIPEIISGESFSCFLVCAYHQLKEKGMLRFLLPDSILNVKSHQDIRRFLLEHGNISAVTRFTESFSGVMTNYITLEVKKEPSKGILCLKDESGERLIDSRNFINTRHYAFRMLEEKDHRIIGKIKAVGSRTLEDSLWALGIVTGDNKGRLADEPLPGYEKIYTGKEICPYILKPAVRYLRYDRASLQQVARDEMYRAPEKLVYRFISNQLMFAYDSTGSLFLNSANILIPKISGMSVQTVMAFLNSEIYQYLYASLFGEVKVLRGNLEELLFPEISAAQDQMITAWVEQILVGDTLADKHIQGFLYCLFQINDEERIRIQAMGQKRRGRKCLEGCNEKSDKTLTKG